MADLAASIISKYYPLSREILTVGGIRVTQLAEKYGTPHFVYDAGVLDKKYHVLRAALPDRFSIYYSIKANPAAAILKHFLNLGCGLEIASAGEFRRALAAACPPERILFAGPGKSEGELELVLSHGIGEIHMESMREAERIMDISRRLAVRAPVGIRINPVDEAEGGAMRMGGRSAPFGIDEELLDRALDAILAMPSLEFCGIHLSAGTQILDASILVRQYLHGLSLARRVTSRIGRPLRTVDFGGGLGIPYFSHEQELSVDALRQPLKSFCSSVDGDSSFKGTRFLIEPGRFLVGEAGVYVVRVLDIKVSRRKKFLIVDGGMNHHLAASGNLGQTIKRNYPISLVNKLDKPSCEAVDIVGPLCTPLDTLGRGVMLPHGEIGDLVGIFQSGAYARTASPIDFLSHALPAEVWVDAGQDSMLLPHGAQAGLPPDECAAGTNRTASSRV